MISDKEKIAQYEKFLHMLQLNAQVIMDGEAVTELISNACAWSYAHRLGNGEFSEEEQQELIDSAFNRLCDYTSWKDRLKFPV